MWESDKGVTSTHSHSHGENGKRVDFLGYTYPCPCRAARTGCPTYLNQTCQWINHRQEWTDYHSMIK